MPEETQNNVNNGVTDSGQDGNGGSIGTMNSENVQASGQMNPMMNGGGMQGEGNKKNNKGLMVAIGVLVAVVVVLIGVIVCLMVFGGKDDGKADKGSSGTSEVGGASDGGMNTKQLEKFVEDLREVAVAAARATISEPEYGDMTYVIYKPDDLKVAVSLEKEYGFKVDSAYSTSDFDVIFGAVEDELLARGFEKYEFDGYYVATQYINSQEGVICSADKTIVRCGLVEWYDKSDIDLKNELAEAYKKKEGKYPTYISTENSEIEDSKYEPYQRVNAGEIFSVLFFYRLSPESEWQFFTETQGPIGCSEYDTNDLKRAYLGEWCMENDGSESEVRL